MEMSGKTAVITGAGGILCGAMGKFLAGRGIGVALLDIMPDKAGTVAEEIRRGGGRAEVFGADVLKRESLEEAAAQVVAKLGPVDFLVNGAGGNRKEASTSDEKTFFDLPAEAVDSVFSLNFTGTFLTSQVFGRLMVQEQKAGAVVNISSMNSFRPLTRIVAYSAAKAAINNFTQWLAVYLARNFSPPVRVNAIAPGFFLTEQNRFLLTEQETDELSPRGRTILEHTPTGRFGNPEDLFSTLWWLLSEDSSFVTGVVVPVDGGFSAYSGV